MKDIELGLELLKFYKHIKNLLVDNNIIVKYAKDEYDSRVIITDIKLNMECSTSITYRINVMIDDRTIDTIYYNNSSEISHIEKFLLKRFKKYEYSGD